MEKWSSASIHDWWNDNPWPCGFNYLPSTAVNFLEFWHPNSFDRETIERELKWAADVSFNSLRVNLSLSPAIPDFPSLQNLCKTIIFAFHTEGQPKLEFSDS